MIGIITKYNKHESTFAALAIAKYLRNMGRAFRFISYDGESDIVNTTYDHVIHKEPFRVWLSKITYAIWTSAADSYFIKEAKKKGVKSILYTSWDQVEPYDERAFAAFSQVLVPTKQQARCIREEFQLKNVYVLPYDCGLPITKKLTKSALAPTKLFISLYGSQLKRVDLTVIFILSNMVRNNNNVHVTIACSTGLSLRTRKVLKQYKKEFGIRWDVRYKCSWSEQEIEMAKHDLVIWPAKWDGFGVVGNTALSMGTPVLGWDNYPVSEHLSAGRNSLLVPCEKETDWLGMPIVVPAYEDFAKILQCAINDKVALQMLSRHTHERVAKTQEDFRNTLESLLPMHI